MGTSNFYGHDETEIGIVPRVIKQVFNMVDSKKDKIDFLIKVNFLEIYNEDIIDLLDYE